MNKIWFAICVLLILFSFSITPVIADSGFDNDYGSGSSGDYSSDNSSSSRSSSSYNNNPSNYNLDRLFGGPMGFSGINYTEVYLFTFCLSSITFIVFCLINKKRKFNIRVLFKVIRVLIYLTILLPLLLLPLFFMVRNRIIIVLSIIVSFYLLFYIYILISNKVEKKQFDKTVGKITKKLCKENNVDKRKINMLVEAYNNDSNLLKKLENSFIDIQLAWMNFDYDKLKELCGSELYTSYKSDLETLSDQKRQNVMKDFEPVKSKIAYVKEEENRIFVTFILNIKFKDYIINIEDSEIVRGSESRVYDNYYELEFMINKKVLDKCPNCGSDINGNECSYCNTIITNNNKDYVLINKKLMY